MGRRIKQRFKLTKKYKFKQLRKLFDTSFAVPKSILDKVQKGREYLYPIEQLNFVGPILNLGSPQLMDTIDAWAYECGDQYERAFLFNHRTKVLKGEISEQQVLTEFKTMKEYYLYVDGRINGTIPMQQL